MRLRLGLESGPVPGEWVFDGTIDLQLPGFLFDVGLTAEVQHRPVLDQMLSGRQSLALRPRMAAGQEFPFGCPALLGRGQLANRIVVHALLIPEAGAARRASSL